MSNTKHNDIMQAMLKQMNLSLEVAALTIVNICETGMVPEATEKDMAYVLSKITGVKLNKAKEAIQYTIKENEFF